MGTFVPRLGMAKWLSGSVFEALLQPGDFFLRRTWPSLGYFDACFDRQAVIHLLPFFGFSSTLIFTVLTIHTLHSYLLLPTVNPYREKWEGAPAFASAPTRVPAYAADMRLRDFNSSSASVLSESDVPGAEPVLPCRYLRPIKFALDW